MEPVDMVHVTLVTKHRDFVVRLREDQPIQAIKIESSNGAYAPIPDIQIPAIKVRMVWLEEAFRKIKEYEKLAFSSACLPGRTESIDNRLKDLQRQINLLYDKINIPLERDIPVSKGLGDKIRQLTLPLGL